MSIMNENNSINIQAIRGGACLFVCLNHCIFFNKYCYGAVGVEFFMIISGLLTAINASKHDHLRNNYITSKIRKIMPLYWIGTMVVFLVGCFMPNLFSSLTFNITNLLFSLFLIPGHTFYLYPGWTLTYFFVFYIIYWFSDKIANQKRDSVAFIIILSLVTLGAISNLVLPGNIFGKYTDPVLLEFAYGIALYGVISKYHDETTLDYKRIFIIVGLLLLLFFDYKGFLGPRWLLLALLTCIVIFILYNSRIDNWIFNRLSKIGDISFTIYILHPLIIRPIDKLCVRLVGFASPLYFVGILFGLAMVVMICKIAQTFLKKVRVL